LADHPQNRTSSALTFLDSYADEIKRLCRKYGLVRLRLFGSSVREDWNANTSDLDFLAEFGPPPDGVNYFKQLFGFSADLEDLLGRPVDIVDWNAARKPHFRTCAEENAQELYAA